VPNEGSRFHFTMAAETLSPDLAVGYGDRETLAGLPVLIVDDNATSRRILASIAARQGMQPTVTADGRDALRQLASQPFRLVLIDCQMPGIDSFALASEIGEHETFSDIPIVMLTPPGKQQDAARCRELDLALLTKPVTDPRFAEAAQLALRSWSEPANAEATRTRRTAQGNGPPLSILLVEDHPLSQTVAARILRNYGYSVTSATTGFEALEAWETEAFDLILMDLQMPEMDGIETTLFIRRSERWNGAHIPIVALTAHAMAGDRETCLAAGMDGFVTKPVRSSDLLDEIKRLSATASAQTALRPKTGSAGA
jgi:CheY-like chemotaxis protein